MTLNERVYAALARALPSVPLIFARQNAPRPPKPYGTLHVRLLTYPGFPVILPVDAEGNQIYSWAVTVDVEVDLFGDHAFSTLSTLPMTIRTPAGRDALTDNGLAVNAMTEVHDLTEILGDGDRTEQYEGRASTELRLMATLEVTSNNGLIEHVVADGRVVEAHVDISKAFTPGVGPLGSWLSGLGYIPPLNNAPSEG